MKAYSKQILWNEFEPNTEWRFLPKVVRRGRKTYKLEKCERWISLDTETAWNHDEENPIAWVYQWAFKFGEQIVIGRRPSEFIAALQTLTDAFGLSDDKCITVFVHNLSYDIEYLFQWLQEAFGKPRILAIKPRKFISFEVSGFLFVCSYKLSNKSLLTWGNDLNVEHKKLAEEKAYYDEVHYQDEALTPDKWDYQIRDVVTLDECVEKQMKAYGDTVLTIPLTSTGYVRRDARRNYKAERKNRKRFLLTRLYPETYKACRGEFAGGLTHGNRFYAGQTVRPEPDKGEFIRHRDFRSHYPTQQRVRKFPVGAFTFYAEHMDAKDLPDLCRKYCVLMLVTFENAHLRRGQVLPVLSATNAYKGRLTPLKMVEDNGRVLDAEGVFQLYLTELDFDLIQRQYRFDAYDIDKAWVSPRGYLPEYMKKTVDEYFYGKTKWKKLVKAEKDRGENADKDLLAYLELELMKSKNGLNGIYGMSATDILRESFKMDEFGAWSVETPDLTEALNKYYDSENSFNRYQFGIYTTSWARYELIEYADLIQKTGGTVLYVDTDSIFYVSNEVVEKAVEALNEKKKEKALSIGAFIEYEGKKVHYDAFEDEKEDITAFRFLHAKCYAYEVTHKSGAKELKCTIAGVTEWEDATRKFGRVDELGTIEELAKGKVFRRCGGTKAAYVMNPKGIYEVNGHKVEAGAACIITPTTKTLKNELETYDEVIDWEVRCD